MVCRRPAPLASCRDLAGGLVERGERLDDDGGVHLAVGHGGGRGGERQVVDVDRAVGDVGLGQRLHQEVLLHRALLHGHGLPVQLRHRLDG